MTDIEARLWERVLAVVATMCLVTLAALVFDRRPDTDTTEEDDSDD